MQTRTVIRRSWIVHLLAWLLVGLTWFYLRYQDYHLMRTAVKVTLIKTIDLALMVYLANYVLIPFLLYRKKYWLFAVSFLAMIATSSFYKMYLIGKLTNNPALFNWAGNLKGRIYDNVIPHIFLVIAGMAIKLIYDHSLMQKRLAEVARQKAEAELNFLKSQINPHFLFNSLNAVYFLIDKDNIEARRTLHQFSEMLRFQLYEAGVDKIPIEKELSYLKDYISLQQLRNDRCNVDLNIDGHMNSFMIEPLLLVPFVENSFKHLSHFSSEKMNEIRINLSKLNGSMDLQIANTMEPARVRIQNDSGGIGLVNVRRRLELLYPQKHILETREENGWFHMHLNIQIDQV